MALKTNNTLFHVVIIYNTIYVLILCTKEWEEGSAAFTSHSLCLDNLSKPILPFLSKVKSTCSRTAGKKKFLITLSVLKFKCIEESSLGTFLFNLPMLLPRLSENAVELNCQQIQSIILIDFHYCTKIRSSY